MPPSFFSALIVGYVVTIVWPDKELEAMYRDELASIDEVHKGQDLAGQPTNIYAKEI